MRIKIEGVEYKVPSSLMEVTLAERIAFDKQYGKALTAQLKKVAEMKDSPLREMEFADYHCSLACKTLSFFGKIPLNIVDNTDINHVMAIYHATTRQMGEEVNFSDKDFKLEETIEWEGDIWRIAPPELKHDSKMTTGEFLDAKQWVKNTYELSQEKWESLIGLCCVYMRKVGEPYTKDLIVEDGERFKLMQRLPMPYALNVGFFLINTIASYMKTFRSSIQAKEVESQDQS